MADDDQPDSRDLFLRSWLISYAKDRDLLMPEQRAAKWEQLKAHLKVMDADQAELEAMAERGRAKLAAQKAIAVTPAKPTPED